MGVRGCCYVFASLYGTVDSLDGSWSDRDGYCSVATAADDSGLTRYIENNSLRLYNIHTDQHFGFRSINDVNFSVEQRSRAAL